MEMHLETYLSRIGFAGPVEPSLEVLRSLHTSHLFSVPFENLTLHSGGRVQLDLPLLYDKIVNQSRGGFCTENNGLFSWLLSRLGFQVTMLSGQVKSRLTGFYGPPFDHLVLMVRLDGQRWLCDVGYGAPCFSTPLSLETSGLQEQGHRVYRIRKVDEGMHFLEWQGEENKGVDGDWTQIYKFTLEPRRLEDFAEMCQYHQSSPCSLFFCKSLCTILRPGGTWVAYLGRKLTSTTISTKGTALETTIRELKDEEIPGVLAEEFGVVLNSPLIPKDETITPPTAMY
ncbi:arylamine N-acetyltransferase, pineal gland isozyme NAT-3-like [Sebastes umbrosus]|uniref:arylamine N-acetyltransferase, pineal gland isozyme NAT-3-like n=1 Tax=Sebastes umbrosus TaxID=72105 RepID=UPI00189CF17A|nr:arylamine N-acetyltransferase, pineal gland isozyme NAT-3-like [Sebastes umbrosus]